MLEDHLGQRFDLEEAKRRFEIGPIVRRYGTWAVTEYGLESLVSCYKIPKARVGSSHWEQHMLEKRWCIPWDFADAIDGARAYFSGLLSIVPEHQRQAEYGRPERTRTARSRSLRARFAVLKRDGYRCQICGANAQSGAQLEIDHKVAKARGGSDDLSNLWTFCFSCNRGKGIEDL